MISAIRDHVMALACIRHGLPWAHGRGMDLLPNSITERFLGQWFESFPLMSFGGLSASRLRVWSQKLTPPTRSLVPALRLTSRKSPLNLPSRQALRCCSYAVWRATPAKSRDTLIWLGPEGRCSERIKLDRSQTARKDPCEMSRVLPTLAAQLACLGLCLGQNPAKNWIVERKPVELPAFESTRQIARAATPAEYAEEQRVFRLPLRAPPLPKR